MCEREDLKESSREEVQQTVKETAEQWRNLLQTAEESLHRAETQAAVEENLNAFKSQKESVLAWVRQQTQTLRSAGSHMTFEERLQIPRVSCDR